MDGLTAISEQQRFPYTCHRIGKVPTFQRLLLKSTSLSALNIYIKIQQQQNKKGAIIVRKCGGFDVTTTNTAAAAAIPVDLATVCLKLNTKKATFRHRLAHHHVKTGSIKWVLAPRLSQYKETGSVRNLVLEHVIFQRPHEFQYVCHSHYCSSTTFFHYTVNILRSVICYTLLPTYLHGTR
jgi:hypothetical protein